MDRKQILIIAATLTVFAWSIVMVAMGQVAAIAALAPALALTVQQIARAVRPLTAPSNRQTVAPTCSLTTPTLPPVVLSTCTRAEGEFQPYRREEGATRREHPSCLTPPVSPVHQPNRSVERPVPGRGNCPRGGGCSPALGGDCDARFARAPRSPDPGVRRPAEADSAGWKTRAANTLGVLGPCSARPWRPQFHVTDHAPGAARGHRSADGLSSRLWDGNTVRRSPAV